VIKKLKSVSKEIVIGLIILFIASNVISYVRSPSLDSSDRPNMQLELIDKTIFNTNLDKPLIIHFWAIWCPICKFEAPNIMKLSEKYEVITVAVDSGDDNAILDYLKEHNINYKVFNDKDKSLATRFKISAYPTTFIYNSKGELSFTEVGYTSTAGLFGRMLLIK
jgi:thiol-disulfide isomerase/thioredoxin